MAKRVQVDASAADVFDSFETEVAAELEPQRWGVWALVGILVLAATVVVVLLVRSSTDSGLKEANADYSTAVTSLNAATSTLKTTVDAAQTALDESAGQVGDDTVRVALADQIDAANKLLVEASEVPANSGLTATDNVERATANVKELTTSIGDQTTSLATATDAVNTAKDQYQLEQANSARAAAESALAGSIQNGEAIYASSAGKVADDTVRQDLRYALDAASQAATDAQDATDLAGVQAATQALDDAKSSVDSAVQAVTDAQGAWQAEQDRRAQEEQQKQQQEQQNADRQGQLDWLRQQPPSGNDPSTGGAWWQFQDPQGNLWCLRSNGQITPC